jgi:nuclear transport factor 2 (NTF2) superfamily protein
MKTNGSDPANVHATPRATKFSLAANYDPELVPALATYPVDEVSEHCTYRISVRYQFEHHSQFGAWKDGFCGVEFLRHFGRQLIRTSIAEVMQVHG